MDTALQSSVYVSSPEFAGWLIKRGFHWRKLWKRRWVALHGAEIVYMEKEPTIENSATMTITKAQITTATVIDREDIDGNPNGFAIHINDGNTPTWYLRAESAREKKSWLMRLAHVHAIVKWLEDFEKVKVLGVGGTGIVYELLHKTNGQRFAMKEMEIKNKAQMQMAVSEAEMLKDIMENVSHPNIMHIEKVFQVGSKFYLVFPLCTGGELYEHIIRRGHFTEHDAAVILRDLISGLHALHQHDILHLDIKPENILFDSMEDDAKIRITDFGLSKLFSNVQGQQSKSGADQFTPEMMAEKLKAFQESGELNRERLRGTVGYMSPELILTGHCSKATDVFAAGVVLYILLCGRPPFNSKSNREVLEKTAKGTYKLTGAEWDDVSAEAKDLVRKMLKTNPLERASTEEILEHPWIKNLEVEEEAEAAAAAAVRGSDATSSVSGSEVGSSPVRRTGTAGSSGAGGRKGSTNLAGALRMLSGHVRHLRSEKLASSMTRIVSMMQNGPAQGTSTLAKLYLKPSKSSAGGRAATQKAIADSAHKAAANSGSRVAGSGGGDGDRAQDAIDEDDMETSTADVELLFMNQDVREAVTEAIYNVVENEEGKLTLEQFLVIAKHFHPVLSSAGAGGAASGGASAGLGIVHLLLCRFVDRDGDGYISVDDLFAAQALIIQRSEVFLKLIFRLYTEAIWYPGRQLNLQNLLSHTNLKINNNAEGGGASASGSGAGSDQRRPSVSSIKVLDNGGSGSLLDVVDPPKFITARHVSAVFEKLGYDGEAGQQVFTVLLEALARQKRESLAGEQAEAAPAVVAAAAAALPSSPNGAAVGDRGSSRNSALAAALAEDFDDDSDDSSDDAEEEDWGLGGGGLNSKQDSSKKPAAVKTIKAKALKLPASSGIASASAGTPPPSSERGSVGGASGGGQSAAAAAGASSGSGAGDFASPLYSSGAAAARTRASSGVWTHGGAEGTPPPVPGSPSTQPTPNPPSATAGAHTKMDVQDFIRAIELDDIFLQAIFRRPRFKMLRLMKKVDERAHLLAKIREQQYQQLQEANGGDAAAAARAMAAYDEELQSKKEGQRRLSGGSAGGRQRAQSVASQETQSVFEEELRTAFESFQLTQGVARAKFPVLAAVGRVGLSAAFGLAAKITKTTSAITEAARETLEGEDEQASDDSDRDSDDSSDSEGEGVGERGNKARGRSRGSSGSEGFADT